MKFSSLTKLSAAPCALAIALAASPALAQDAADDCVDADENGVCDTEDTSSEGDAADETFSDNLILVSGSRIARPNLDSPVPVTSIAAGDLLDDGSVSLGDALNDLPSLRSTFSSSNSQRFIGTSGLSLLDLRGLGTSRTLVLVNGRRHITAQPGDFQIDVNTIPFELLERVDVVTGGSSAVYGSDAIAGVVNFVLSRDFEGLEVNGQYGISDRGDQPTYSISAAWGKNFADGRGNIAIVAEHTSLGSVLNSQRPENSGFGIGFTAFETVDDDAGELTNADGTPDTVLTDGLFLDFISEGGTVQNFCIFGAAIQPLSCQADGNNARLRFGSDGRLFREENTVFPSGRALGGTGTALSDGTLIPDIDRININLLGHFDVSDAFRPYWEFKYARIEALGQGTPSFFNSFCGGLNGASGLDPSCADGLTSAPFFINFDNAFLDPADATTLRQVQDELLQGFGFPAGVGGALSQGFFINRNNSDFGTRNDDVVRETYRAVVGFEGDIASNTRYDVSFTYGKFESVLDSTSNLIYQNARNAVDAVFAPDGSIQCRINVDADTTNDDGACVPLNVLGFGAPSQEALAYINSVANLFEDAEQYDLLAYVSTDSSPFFELPGGPVSVVVGGEWRKETAFAEPDALSASGATFFNVFDVFDPPSLEVIELFGEIQIPLLADIPFFNELTISGAGRMSDYNSGGGSTGTVQSYNANGVWSPVEDLKLRANYSRAVRAPTLSNLFAAQTQNFVFFDDPCDIDFINNGTSQRGPNCAADGVPAGYDDQVTGNRAVLQGGNPDLQAETSNSYTFGGIFEPRWVPGLSLSVDYYDITVNNVIATVGAQQIISNCYDLPRPNSFCGAVNDRQADGSLNPDAALLTGPINFAKLTAEGIDFDLQYDKTFDNDDRLSLRLIATHVLDRTNFLDVDNPDLPDEDRGELGDPMWAANFGASYRTGSVTLSYDLRWVGRQFIGARENYRENTEVCSTGTIPRTTETCTIGTLVTAPPRNADAFEEVFYPERFTHDIRIDFDVDDTYNFYVGVDNLTNEQPPFGLTGAGAGSGIFDNTGRFFYSGINLSF